MQVELVRTVTRDGLRLDGALTPARRGSAGMALDAAVLLHGVGGNFYSVRTLEPLIARLGEQGIATLAANTRGHDAVFEATLGTVRRRLGAAFEIVAESRLDIAAWIEHLQSRGYQRIALIGHSLGAIKSVYAQAHENFAAVSAVVAISGPRLSYAAFMNAPESSRFWESMQTAQQLVRAGRGDDLFTSKFPFPLLISAASYLDKYGPAEQYNLLKFAGQLTCPVLYLYGTKELAGGGIAFAGMPAALGDLAGGQRRTIQVVEGADHFYSGVAADLADRVAKWFSVLVQNPANGAP